MYKLRVYSTTQRGVKRTRANKRFLLEYEFVLLFVKPVKAYSLTFYFVLKLKKKINLNSNVVCECVNSNGIRNYYNIKFVSDENIKLKTSREECCRIYRVLICFIKRFYRFPRIYDWFYDTESLFEKIYFVSRSVL